METRQLLRHGRGWLAERLGLNERARARLDGTCAALLYYHRVVSQSIVQRDSVEAGMYVTPESFEQQLDWIDEHIRVLPLWEITERLASHSSLPARACAITFDDGWRDNYDHAVPALARHDLPATIFVVTDRVGSEGAFWPDEICRRLAPLEFDEQRRIATKLGAGSAPTAIDGLLHHYKRMDERQRCLALDDLRKLTESPSDVGRELMDWHEIAQAAMSGIDIESHAASHAILTGLSTEEVASELRRSRESLRERGYGRRNLLAYPSGGHDEGVMNAAREAGYRAAVTIEHGLASTRDDLLALPRLCVHQGIAGSRGEFLLKIPGSR
jgi:peptidoglycan/xylan/chitin deacetylase (PgdA/CDA1 family)